MSSSSKSEPLLDLSNVPNEECTNMLKQFYQLLLQPEQFEELKNLGTKGLQECENEFKPLIKLIEAIGNADVKKEIIYVDMNDESDSSKGGTNTGETKTETPNATNAQVDKELRIKKAAFECKEERKGAFKWVIEDFRTFLSTHDPNANSIIKDALQTESLQIHLRS